MGSASDLSLQLEARNGVVRIAVGGELDMASAPALAGSLEGAGLGGTDAIILDLRDTTFIDSSGLRTILKASQHAKSNGHQLAIVGVNPSARQLFELTGTEHLIDEQEFVTVLTRFTDGHVYRAPEASLDRADRG
jgi:anti-anti-sigma factor